MAERVILHSLTIIHSLANSNQLVTAKKPWACVSGNWQSQANETTVNGSSLVALCHAQVPAVQRISCCSNSFVLILHRLLVSSRCLWDYGFYLDKASKETAVAFRSCSILEILWLRIKLKLTSHIQHQQHLPAKRSQENSVLTIRSILWIYALFQNISAEINADEIVCHQ